MKTIHKRMLALTDVQTLDIPTGAKFLTAQLQGANIVAWYECHPKAHTEPRHIVIVGTGHDIPDTHKLDYIATVQMGALVWHIYEALK